MDADTLCAFSGYLLVTLLLAPIVLITAQELTESNFDYVPCQQQRLNVEQHWNIQDYVINYLESVMICPNRR